jgi:SAM-dependent methyltransferase
MSPKKHEKLTHEFYFGEQAEFYGSSQWMAKNQVKTACRVLELLEDEKIGGQLRGELKGELVREVGSELGDINEFSNMIFLDIGCGSGYSSIIFEDNGGTVIGLDLSMDMLMQNLLLHQSNNENKRILPTLINASINNIPLRDNCVNHVISISAFNFILDNLIDESSKKNELKSIVKDLNNITLSKARIVIEFYPEKKDLELYLNAFSAYFNGGLIIDNAGLRKEQKFLILQKKR